MLYRVIVFLGAIRVFGFDLQKMTLEEKVGQCLMVHFHGEEANPEAKELAQKMKVGGIIYYNRSNGLHSPEQVRALSMGLQELAKSNPLAIPLFIAVDQEGGRVARLNQGFTEFPGNKALGETGEPALAQQAAFIMGEEMQAVGVNMNLAPVVDVNNNPKNPVIGARSFGTDPKLVTIFGEKALEGYRQAGIIATLKHFPGHGDVSIDSHKDLPIVKKSREELEAQELFPFARLSPFADAIMTAHILVPALDKENCATLSAQTLGFLREEIGFQGVIVSDSLVMRGVLKRCGTVDEASILALNAGCDLLILGGKLLNEESTVELTLSDIQRVHQSIVSAVKEGRVSEERLNDAVERILKLKERYIRLDFGNKIGSINTLEHQSVAEKIVSLSLGQ